jgi:hypothetical protein
MRHHEISCSAVAGALMAISVAWERLIQVISEYIYSHMGSILCHPQCYPTKPRVFSEPNPTAVARFVLHILNAILKLLHEVPPNSPHSSSLTKNIHGYREHHKNQLDDPNPNEHGLRAIIF